MKMKKIKTGIIAMCLVVAFAFIAVPMTGFAANNIQSKQSTYNYLTNYSKYKGEYAQNTTKSTVFYVQIKKVSGSTITFRITRVPMMGTFSNKTAWKARKIVNGKVKFNWKDAKGNTGYAVLYLQSSKKCQLFSKETKHVYGNSSLRLTTNGKINLTK